MFMLLSQYYYYKYIVICKYTIKIKLPQIKAYEFMKYEYSTGMAYLCLAHIRTKSYLLKIVHLIKLTLSSCLEAEVNKKDRSFA